MIGLTAEQVESLVRELALRAMAADTQTHEADPASEAGHWSDGRSFGLTEAIEVIQKAAE